MSAAYGSPLALSETDKGFCSFKTLLFNSVHNNLIRKCTSRIASEGFLDLDLMQGFLKTSL